MTESGTRFFRDQRHPDQRISIEQLKREYGEQITNGSIDPDELSFSQHLFNCMESQGGTLRAKSVIVATGGVSYPSTGSTGDGYLFAKENGLNVTRLSASLVGLTMDEKWPTLLQGLSLKNVRITAKVGKKTIYSELGEMLFTHFGVSGPTIISASSFINRLNLCDVYISLDLKPALTEEQLDARVLRDFEKYKNKAIKNSLDDLLPKAMIPVVIKAAGINGDIKNNELKAENRRKIVAAIKDFRMYPHSLRDLNEAIVTSGGVSVKEIDPKTMESKLVKGLFFAGEVIDADALTGGFNITIAACTAYSAGNA